MAFACLLVCCSESMAHARGLVLFMPDEDWPPYQMNDPSFQSEGVILDVLREMIKPFGLSLGIEALPKRRGWDMLTHGEVDIHASAREWVEEPDRFLWTEPFLLNEDVLLFKAGKTIPYVSPDSLKGCSVAAMDDFVYPVLEPSFREGTIKRVDCESPYSMLEMLDRGRVDAALVNRGETLWLFRNHPELHPERFAMDKTPFDSAWYRFILPRERGWEKYIGLFNQRLKAMKRDGTLKAILDRYR